MTLLVYPGDILCYAEFTVQLTDCIFSANQPQSFSAKNWSITACVWFKLEVGSPGPRPLTS